MEPVVVLTSLLRLCLVGAVYILNAFALVRLTTRARGCVHALTSAAVILSGLLYLTSWAPYLLYSLTDGRWLLLGANRHCVLQHFVTSETGLVLLALLAVRVLYRFLVRVVGRPSPTARTASLVTCLAWLGPQLTYDMIALMVDDAGGQSSSYHFLDNVMELSKKGLNETCQGYRVGFMVCMQRLDGPVVSYFAWQYAVVVLPLGGLVLFCAIRLLLKKKKTDGRWLTTEKSCDRLQLDKCDRTCNRDTLVDMSLYYNLIWLLLLRPLAILHAIYLQNGASASYIDIGSHLVLTFSCVFSPFSPRVGLCQPFKCRNYGHLPEDLSPVITADEDKNSSTETAQQKSATVVEASGESFC